MLAEGTFFFEALLLGSVETDSYSHLNRERQLRCMEILIGLDNYVSKESALIQFKLIRASTFSYDPCEWYGITCTRGMITQISWTSSTPVAILCLKFLPPTLRSLSFIEKGISSSLVARELPRDLIYLCVQAASLSGGIEFHLLPRNMEELHLQRNHFLGTLSIGDMPQRMRYIDLQHNPISRVNVWNEKLPSTLEYIYVGDMSMKVKIVGIDGPVQKVFRLFYRLGFTLGFLLCTLGLKPTFCTYMHYIEASQHCLFHALSIDL